jgi:[ribosomal protein S5]-alanine N-acetyltransferase
MTTIQININLSISEFDPTKDKTDLIYHINDLEVAKNTLTIPHPYTEKNADFYFNLVKELDEKHEKPTTFAIRYDGKLIGGIGRLVSYGLDAHKDEFGYYLGKDFRNRGIMTQVVVAFCDFLHQKHGLIRIEAGVFLTNPASMSVLRKAGFEEEGIQRKYHKKGDEYKDVLLFSKVY